jgi:hypothetical protein
MASLRSWWDAHAWALEHGYQPIEAIDYADQHFPCPGCGEAECGATCSGMVENLTATIEAEEVRGV